jgi:hypothetical protein
MDFCITQLRLVSNKEEHEEAAGGECTPSFTPHISQDHGFDRIAEGVLSHTMHYSNDLRKLTPPPNH